MVFSIPSYLGLGDRYKRAIDERSKGYTFLVSRPKKGRNPDALFEKEHKYIWNGVRDSDMRRREQQEKKKKILTPNGFVYSSPPQKREGLGSYFGCFQSTPYPNIPEHPLKRSEIMARVRALKHSVEQESNDRKRPIYTSPAKKGTYGYANLGISDIGTEYIATFYDQEAINNREDREKWRKKMPPNPFKPAGRSGFTFDEAVATGVSKCYTMTVPFRPKRAPTVLQHFVVDKPWRPAGFVDDMENARRVEYWEDPYRGYDPREDRKEKLKMRKAKAETEREAFKPSSNSDSFWYTQSVVFKRL